MAGYPRRFYVRKKAEDEARERGALPDEIKRAGDEAEATAQEYDKIQNSAFAAAQKRKQRPRFLVIGGIVLVCIVLAAILIW